MSSTAATSNSEQPRPYSVSVGNATTPPRMKAWATASRARRSGRSGSTVNSSKPASLLEYGARQLRGVRLQPPRQHRVGDGEDSNGEKRGIARAPRAAPERADRHAG